MNGSLYSVIIKYGLDTWEKLLMNSAVRLKTPCPMTVQVSKALGCTEKEAGEVLNYIWFVKEGKQ